MTSNPANFWWSYPPKIWQFPKFYYWGWMCWRTSVSTTTLDQYLFSHDNGNISQFTFDSTCPVLSDVEISTPGILNLLLKMDCKKSPGSDGIPNSFLRRYSLWTSKHLSVIFEKSVVTAIIPRLWKSAKIIPFKSGNKQVVANFRPISRTSSSCKLLEHIVHKHVSEYLEANSILCPQQHGFHRDYQPLPSFFSSLMTLLFL